MRRFHSYGPVDCKRHFCVPRQDLIERCLESLIGDPEEGGHYFTIWAPRQTGKTWLMRQVLKDVPNRYGDQFVVFSFSLGRLRGMNFSPSGEPGMLDFPKAFGELLWSELPGQPDIKSWTGFYEIFSKERGLWDRPLILLIDEVDTIPSTLIDLMIAQFRELYLTRETNRLHGLALIGVRAVLGIGSQRGSPFNIQRSLHVPNLTKDEVTALYDQYQAESGQNIEPAVVEEIFRVTNGQPGLVSWFGELLTETYNPGKNQTIEMNTWKTVWLHARFTEPNNTLMNLIAKARDPEYQPFLTELFTRSDIPFSFHKPLHNYLYLHGILDSETITTPSGEEQRICRFTSSFVQQCLYEALSDELFGDSTLIPALDPLDDLADVFEGPVLSGVEGACLDLPALLRRYTDYLGRLKAKGINPWKEQPRRKTDFHLTEAVGHFHLFTWLQAAIGRRCVVSPEFPTGNGKVDIHLRCGEKRGLLEVKSFVDAYQAKLDRIQAARYAKNLGFETVTLATFLPVEDEIVLEKISGEEVIEGVRVIIVAIGWV
jgi:hypothetical protein